MTMYSAVGTSLPSAYHNALQVLAECGENVSCPAWNTTQKELSLTFKVYCPTSEPMISKLFPGGFYELEQYREEMLDGILDFEIDKGNWEYTYHQRIATQIPRIIEILKDDPYSRRAVISVRDEHDIYSDNPACLQHIQYFIRNGCLDCYVLFRSNDAVKATFMNAFALIMLQKRVADELGVNVGTYTHTANSFHCYERDFETLDRYIKAIDTKTLAELTYNYDGEWKELMDEASKDIATKVEELKGH